jgi:hypothetical protein
MGEEHHALCALHYAQVPFELDPTGRDPYCPLLAGVFRFTFHNLASVGALGVTVVGLSHLSTTRTLDQLSDLLIRNLLKDLVLVADGQQLEGCLAASFGVRVLG